MKYKLYRSFGDLDKDVKKHEFWLVTPNMLDVKHLPMRRKL